MVTVFGLFHCSPTSRDMLMLDVIEGCLGESNRSGWCSGYHARFTRERSRVQSSHPIFFYMGAFFFCTRIVPLSEEPSIIIYPLIIHYS